MNRDTYPRDDHTEHKRKPTRRQRLVRTIGALLGGGPLLAGAAMAVQHERHENLTYKDRHELTLDKPAYEAFLNAAIDGTTAALQDTAKSASYIQSSPDSLKIGGRALSDTDKIPINVVRVILVDSPDRRVAISNSITDLSDHKPGEAEFPSKTTTLEHDVATPTLLRGTDGKVNVHNVVGQIKDMRNNPGDSHICWTVSDGVSSSSPRRTYTFGKMHLESTDTDRWKGSVTIRVDHPTSLDKPGINRSGAESYLVEDMIRAGVPIEVAHNAEID